jgi:hypothetical protein
MIFICKGQVPPCPSPACSGQIDSDDPQYGTGQTEPVSCPNLYRWARNQFPYDPVSQDDYLLVHLNFIFVQNSGGLGNFEASNAEQNQQIDDVLATTNWIYSHMSAPSNWTPCCNPNYACYVTPDLKIQFEYSKIYIQVSDWSNENHGYCPGGNSWFDYLEVYAKQNPNYQPGIDVYMTTSQTLYENLIVNQNTTQHNTNGRLACSQFADYSNLNRTSRIHLPDFYTKWWWMKNIVPYDTTYNPGLLLPYDPVIRQWDYGSKGHTLAHELGHSFDLAHDCVHYSTNQCFESLLNQGYQSPHSYLPPSEVGNMYRALHLSNIRKFVVPNCINTNPFHVTNNLTWDFDLKWFQDIIIDSGATLTINCNLYMVTNARIIVKPGGTLLVDGGKISADNVNKYWQGIEVWGHSAMSQYPVNGVLHQGLLVLKNHAIIENAIVAVNLWNPNDWNSMGGIIEAQASVFRNNWKSVQFMSYHNFFPNNGLPAPNQSKFILDSILINDNTPFESFDSQISMWDVSGINYTGCTFIDQRTLNNDSQYMGKGIYSEDATYTVNAYCTSQMLPCPPVSMTPSLFQGFKFGISVLNSLKNITVTLLDSKFMDNVFGIYMDNTSQARVLKNEFNIGGNTALNESTNMGIYFRMSTGYRIEENSFIGNMSQSKTNIGLYIFNSGIENNEVYKNSFLNLNSASISDALNRNPNNPFNEGLQFLCNTYDDDGVTGKDISILRNQSIGQENEHGIRTFQGSTISSAGNVFTQETLTLDESDIFNNSKNLIYYHHTGSVYIPLDIDSLLVYPVLVYNTNTCPSKIDGSHHNYLYTESELNGLKSEIASDKTALGNLQYNYTQLIDGGNKTQLINQIDLSWPEDAWTLRNSLIVHSPYLSMDVLKAAFAKNILPPAMILELCLSNPDATRSEDFLEFLQNFGPTPLPDYMIDLIRSSHNLNTVRTNLERLIASYSSDISSKSNIIISDTKGDSLANNNDTIAHLLYQRQNLPSYYTLIDHFTMSNHFNRASDSLEKIQEYFGSSGLDLTELDHYLTWFNFRKTNFEAGRNLMQLDSAEVEYLDGLANSYNDFVGTSIRNTLCFGYNLCNDILIGSACPKISVRTSGQEKPVSFCNIKDYPNPCDKYLIIEIPADYLKSNANVVIFDNLGKKIESLPISTKVNIIIIKTDNYVNGSYLLTIDDRQNPRSSVKFQVKH